MTPRWCKTKSVYGSMLPTEIHSRDRSEFFIRRAAVFLDRLARLCPNRKSTTKSWKLTSNSRSIRIGRLLSKFQFVSLTQWPMPMRRASGTFVRFEVCADRAIRPMANGPGARHTPTGDGSRGLGTEHASIEPALLFQRNADRSVWFGEFVRAWIPISPNKEVFPLAAELGGPGGELRNYAGTILRYGLVAGPPLSVRLRASSIANDTRYRVCGMDHSGRIEGRTPPPLSNRSKTRRVHSIQTFSRIMPCAATRSSTQKSDCVGARPVTVSTWATVALLLTTFDEEDASR